MWMDRAFSFLDGDAPGTRPAKIRAFELLLVLIVVVEYWARAIPKWQGLPPALAAGVALVTVLGVAAMNVRWRRAAFLGLAVTHAFVISVEFPASGNHAYLELVFLLLLALLDVGDDAQQVLFLRSARWLVVIVFFYSGLQKLVNGYWADAQYLAYSLWRESYQAVLRPLLPAAEYQRLADYSRQLGDGPYLVAAPLLVGISNAVWMMEMALAPLIAFARTRGPAALAGIALLVAIEAGARELFFGLLFTSTILLCFRGNVIGRLVPVFVAVLTGLLLSRLGVLPEVVFN